MRIERIAAFVAIAMVLPRVAPARASLFPDPSPTPFDAAPVLDRSPVGRGGALEVAIDVPRSAEALLAQRAIRDKEKKEEAKEMERAGEIKPKSPGKALLFSAVVPGSGQLYNGAKRGFVYMGVEALSWFAYFSFHKAGDDKEVEFERYADGHWDIDRLKAAVSDTTCPDPVPNQDDIERLEEFRDSNEQHYYEDIGKLDVYQCGWDNQANRDAYRDMRQESNRLLTNARRATTLAFINHIASAVDAFLLTKKYNKHLGQGIDLKFEMMADVRNPRGKITFTRRFF